MKILGCAIVTAAGINYNMRYACGADHVPAANTCLFEATRVC